MDRIAAIRACIAAATVEDLALRVAYTASARANLDALRREVDELERLVAAREGELLRATEDKGPGGPLAEREGSP